ncbi:adenylate/guanylate cyclase domain-containing protein, partial [bacterium]
MLSSLRPSGTVTFLFTDVEGSTRLWDNHPQAMQPALARHDAILRETIAAAGGWTFKTIGDAFCAAFATAPAALQAAVEAQRRLSQEAWPEPVRIRVRMALHTGSVESRDDDYFGPPLNRVARRLAAGHGGQTLITEVVQELVRDSLSPNVSLRPLGEHRLRDLVRPEQIYQVVHDGIFEEFPPLKTLDSPDLPNNLPLGTTSFVGRQKELADVIASIGSGRLTTLLGPGGCGKTRLALQAAADVLENFPDGVWFVDLAALSDSALVPGAALAAIGIREQPGESPSATLVEALKPRRLLLVLDNCEHLIEACARLVTELLRSCREVKVVATSREALGIAGERTVRVPSLSTPDPAQRATVESLGQYDAVRLFVERATQHQPSFSVTNENAPAIAQLCHRLDGIPLALELAAARVRSLPVEEVNRRLDNLFRLLTGGDRTALPRQQTLRAAIDWSFELLSPTERTLLLRLGAFSGGWTLDAADAVAAGGEIEEWEVLDGLTSLVDKSLVVLDGERYRMLETIRQYVRERTPSEEIEATADRHRDYFLHQVVGRAGIRERTAKGAHDAIAREFPNVRLAIERMLAEPGPEHIGHWLVLALFWMRRGGLGEAIPLVERLLAVARHWSPSFDVANLLIWMGAVY